MTFSTFGVPRKAHHTLISRRHILSKVSRLDVHQVKASASLAWGVPQMRKGWAAPEQTQEVALRAKQVSINQMQETGRVFLVSHAMPTHIIRRVVRVHLVGTMSIKLAPRMLHLAMHARNVRTGSLLMVVGLWILVETLWLAVLVVV